MDGRRISALGGSVLIVLSLLSCKGSQVGGDEQPLPIGGDSQAAIVAPAPTGAAAGLSDASDDDAGGGDGSHGGGGRNGGDNAEVPGVSAPADPPTEVAVVEGIPGVGDQPVRGPDLDTDGESDSGATDQPPVDPELSGQDTGEVAEPEAPEPGDG